MASINDQKIKKKDIKIDLNVIMEYCEFRHNMQRTIFPKFLDIGRYDRLQANTYFLIIQEFKDLCEDLKKSGIKWNELRGLVKESDKYFNHIFIKKIEEK